MPRLHYNWSHKVMQNLAKTITLEAPLLRKIFLKKPLILKFKIDQIKIKLKPKIF